MCRTPCPAGHWRSASPGCTSGWTAPTAAEQRRERLDAAVKHLFEDSGRTYGSPRIHTDLVEAGWQIGQNTVAASMRRQGLVFLGFTFRRRPARLRDGRLKTGFLPAVSKQAKKSMARTIRRWKLGRWTALSFQEVAARINPIVAGWINYYGHFYKSELIRFLEQRINPFLVKWAMRKYKRYRRARRKARTRLAEIASVYPGMLAHWKHGALPTGSTTGAV